MSDEAPEPSVEPMRRSLLERVSIVWVVPIAALAISLGIAWQNWSQRGPVIEIAFENASGVEAGATELRYRDVSVGVVEDVHFSPGLDSVVVQVRVENDVAPYVDSDAEFWVVRPEVTAQGVSGLGTVLSGVYIEGSWDTEPGGLQQSFEGLPRPPVSRPDERGLRILLTSPEGAGFSEGTPVIYHGVEVGRVANLRLSEDGATVLADAFVEAPYDDFVTDTSRFWDTSGFAFSLGPQGATLDVSSLSALVQGGVAFDQFVEGGEPVQPGERFELFNDRAGAQASVFDDPEGSERVRVSIIFSGDVAGLSSGASVEFRGIEVGQVTSVTGHLDEERFGDRRVRLRATAELRPDRLGVGEEATSEDSYDFLADLVEDGLRAQLARGSILTGELQVNLLELPGAAPAELDIEGEPYPVLPSVEADLPDRAATAEGVFQRINQLPIEEFLGSALALLRNANSVVGSEAVQQAPEEAVGLLSDLRSLVGSEGVQVLPERTSEVLATLDEATTELTAVLAQVREAETVETLTAALASARDTAETASDLAARAGPTVDAAPALVDRLTTLSDEATALLDEAEALPLEQLVTETTETVAAVRMLVDSPELQELPASVSTALAELEGALAELRGAGLAAQATQTLAATESAADSVTAADIPALVARIDSLAATVETVVEDAAALPLEQLVAETTQSVAAVRTLVNNPELQDLPASASTTLAELEGAIADLRASGLVGQATETLTAAERAADVVASAGSGVPALVEQLNALAATANALPLQGAVERAESALAAVDAMLSSEAAAQLPATASATLEELRATVALARESGVVASADAALAATGRAADAVTRATEGVPGLVDDLSELAGTANALPLERLVNQAADTADAAEALLASEDAAELPGSLNAALAEVETTLAELRAGDLVENATGTLAATSRVADAVAEASDRLPELIARFDQLADEASATLTTYDADSALSREAREALRQVREAARSVSSLARAIERDPNSLLLGR